MIEGISLPKFELGDLVSVELSAVTKGGRTIKQRVDAFIVAVHIFDLAPDEAVYTYTLGGRPDNSSLALPQLCAQIGFDRLETVDYYNNEPWPESQLKCVNARAKRSKSKVRSKMRKSEEPPTRALDV